jgi:hypothetical protein
MAWLISGLAGIACIITAAIRVCLASGPYLLIVRCSVRLVSHPRTCSESIDPTLRKT